MQSILGLLGIASSRIDRQAVHRDQSEVGQHGSNRCLTNYKYMLHFIVFDLSIQVLKVQGHEILWVYRTHQRQWPWGAPQRGLV